VFFFIVVQRASIVTLFFVSTKSFLFQRRGLLIFHFSGFASFSLILRFLALFITPLVLCLSLWQVNL